MISVEIKSRKVAVAVLENMAADHAAKFGKVAYGAFLWDSLYKQVEEEVITCSKAEFDSVCKQWKGYMSGDGHGYSVIKCVSGEGKGE